MKIGIDARLLPFAGAGVYTRELIRALSQLPGDHRLALITDANSEHLTAGLPPKARAEIHRMRSRPLTLAPHLEILSVYLRARWDVYHYPHFDVPLAHRYRMVVTVHDLYPLLLPGYCSTPERVYFRGVVSIALRRASGILTVSENTRRDLVRSLKVPEQSIVVTYPGVGEEFRPATEDAQDDHRLRASLSNYGITSPGYVLFVGSHKPHKNIVTLVRAYAHLPAEVRAEHPLVIASRPRPEEYPELYTEPERLGISAQVRFIGRVDEEDLPMLHQGARVLVLPSLYEGFGLPVVEAMSCGTPVVVSDRGALPEVGGDAVQVVPALDDVEMGGQILRLLSDDGWWAEKRDSGIKRAAQFSWETAARRTLRVYQAAAR